ncbi:hypothetical protein ACFPZL_06305 [Leucobacter soli]|uniref:Flavin-dependent monooxygenase, oxygenase subunit HsaA n=1 Tax=Leucobacter soli TaxID=2812850 RepID=A0A916JXJ0_9MICO|nr:hypothetical protein [Leucobacter soli]CAG7610312.1 Flavin-dependent monooxygenase, oxygenase subunit HsaA [Leucobacter soli]
MSRGEFLKSSTRRETAILFPPADTSDFGLSGPSSLGPSTEADPELRERIDGLLRSAREIRPTLRANQARTEAEATYSPEVHEFFAERGIYRALRPRRFGGEEIGIPGYFRLISEIARGCPSTAWCVSLGAGHNLQIGSYWPERAQREIFGVGDYFLAPGSSSGGSDVRVTPVDGGYRISGFWRYCSGAPYSTHFHPTAVLPETGESAWLVVPRDDYEIIGDWGQVLGMRGSGSNSIRIADAFVPEHMVVPCNWMRDWEGPTVGSELHGNTVYAGTFGAFAEGEVAAVCIGLGYAALDEYERVIFGSKAPYAADGSKRIEHEDWRRTYGIAQAQIDAAAGSVQHAARLYEIYAEESATGVQPFTAERTSRLSYTHFVAQQLVWDAVQSLVKTAGTTQLAGEARLQRYLRDIITANTRTDSLEYGAESLLRARYSVPQEEVVPSIP